ncbi:hypothetical protein [Mycoplasma sp. 5370]
MNNKKSIISKLFYLLKGYTYFEESWENVLTSGKLDEVDMSEEWTWKWHLEGYKNKKTNKINEFSLSYEYDYKQYQTISNLVHPITVKSESKSEPKYFYNSDVNTLEEIYKLAGNESVLECFKNPTLKDKSLDEWLNFDAKFKNYTFNPFSLENIIYVAFNEKEVIFKKYLIRKIVEKIAIEFFNNAKENVKRSKSLEQAEILDFKIYKTKIIEKLKDYSLVEISEKTIETCWNEIIKLKIKEYEKEAYTNSEKVLIFSNSSAFELALKNHNPYYQAGEFILLQDADEENSNPNPKYGSIKISGQEKKVLAAQGQGFLEAGTMVNIQREKHGIFYVTKVKKIKN